VERAGTAFGVGPRYPEWATSPEPRQQRIGPARCATGRGSTCPAHLQALAERIQPAAGDRADGPWRSPPHEEICGRIWLLLDGALSRYLRLHAANLGRCSVEEQEDIAAQKALMLMKRITSGEWRPGDRSPAEIAAFLSRIARNALIDGLRSQDRWAGGDALECAAAQSAAAVSPAAPGRPVEPPDLALERGEFVEALRECARRLKPRARTAWFFRVFYEMPSKTIACHPEVDLKPAHVDVLLQRCRAVIRDCMREKGHRPQDMPAGTFAELWMALRCEQTAGSFPGGAR
jgi:RNA polymerase sigma factor (sigma-70 family)